MQSASFDEASRCVGFGPSSQPSPAARNLGINSTMLGRWKRQVESRNTSSFGGNGVMSAEQQELQRLRKENKRVRMERDILKKTVSFFASESS